MWLWTARSSSASPPRRGELPEGLDPLGQRIAAQTSLTSTSSRPCSARTRANSRSTSASTVWSVRTATPRPPPRSPAPPSPRSSRAAPRWRGARARCGRCSRRWPPPPPASGDAPPGAARGPGDDGDLIQESGVGHRAPSGSARSVPRFYGEGACSVELDDLGCASNRRNLDRSRRGVPTARPRPSPPRSCRYGARSSTTTETAELLDVHRHEPPHPRAFREPPYGRVHCLADCQNAAIKHRQKQINNLFSVL